ncbi:hypothetical protein [Nocardia brasiliensis]|uniref:hypothetical protein n=1 Tax=Nocardia brasiliensis TaxID=37326 RepID=UPI002457343F|nr:hypothetical protein [Nocardia brasiliensis]
MGQHLVLNMHMSWQQALSVILYLQYSGFGSLDSLTAPTIAERLSASQQTPGAGETDVTTAPAGGLQQIAELAHAALQSLDPWPDFKDPFPFPGAEAKPFPGRMNPANTLKKAGSGGKIKPAASGNNAKKDLTIDKVIEAIGRVDTAKGWSQEPASAIEPIKAALQDANSTTSANDVIKSVSSLASLCGDTGGAVGEIGKLVAMLREDDPDSAAVAMQSGKVASSSINLVAGSKPIQKQLSSATRTGLNKLAGKNVKLGAKAFKAARVGGKILGKAAGPITFALDVAMDVYEVCVETAEKIDSAKEKGKILYDGMLKLRSSLKHILEYPVRDHLIKWQMLSPERRAEVEWAANVLVNSKIPELVNEGVRWNKAYGLNGENQDMQALARALIPKQDVIDALCRIGRAGEEAEAVLKGLRVTSSIREKWDEIREGKGWASTLDDAAADLPNGQRQGFRAATGGAGLLMDLFEGASSIVKDIAKALTGARGRVDSAISDALSTFYNAQNSAWASVLEVSGQGPSERPEMTKMYVEGYMNDWRRDASNGAAEQFQVRSTVPVRVSVTEIGLGARKVHGLWALGGNLTSTGTVESSADTHVYGFGRLLSHNSAYEITVKTVDGKILTTAKVERRGRETNYRFITTNRDADTRVSVPGQPLMRFWGHLRKKFDAATMVTIDVVQDDLDHAEDVLTDLLGNTRGRPR